MKNTISYSNDYDLPPNSRENLHCLLNQIIKCPDLLTEFTPIIENTFGQKKAVLVLDMCGFSRTTQLLGIISFLLMIDQMQSVAIPSIEQNGGIVIKAPGDNLYCLFDKAADAVRASRQINKRLNAENAALPVERQLHASFGIGYGKILNIADEDIFGDEVNLACKLGEDIADKGQILISSGAMSELGEANFGARESSVNICGISLNYYILEEDDKSGNLA